MADFFFDTSALVKRYHMETGSPRVEAIFAAEGADHAISGLSVVEFHSSFAKKVRMGQLTAVQFRDLAKGLRRDVASKRLRVVRLKVSHYETAIELIQRIGLARNLRTLDALQLAVALSLSEPRRPVEFVCADQALCGIASAEGLAVVNPELG